MPDEAMPIATTAPSGFRTTLLKRALRDPLRALAHALALGKGFAYPYYYRATGRRVRAGRRFAVFGILSVRGPGEVVFGDNVALWGRVNTWTYDRNARIIVGDGVMMGGTRFGCVREIRVGEGCILADASIRDTDFHSTRADRRSPNAPVRVAPVDIGVNVWVGAGAVLLPGTVIGENSVVGAAAVCMRGFPANKVIIGNPAKVAMPIPSADDPARGAFLDGAAAADQPVADSARHG
ncbi:MAG TPA: acyltransferase [Gemmatimonadaceae bacterium]|nr:acyltransferase [Gemmatimonadaceae bacterium]